MAHNGHHIEPHDIERAAGATVELLKQGGYLGGRMGTSIHRGVTRSHGAHASAQMVQSLAQYAPHTVAAIAVVAPPVAVVAAAGYGIYKLWKWLDS